MENNRVKFIMETMWSTQWQGAEGSTGLLQSAVLSLCAAGKVTKEEAVYARDTLDAQLQKMGNKPQKDVFVAVTPELADDAVLWLRTCAAEAEEPFATVIQQAAEYLHDFWSEVIDALPAEAE